MNWFKRLFTTSENMKNVDKFSVEYYPENGSYYAKKNDMYLMTHYLTGIIELERDLIWAQRHEYEESARSTIKKYKEQQYKENVITIKVD